MDKRHTGRSYLTIVKKAGAAMSLFSVLANIVGCLLIMVAAHELGHSLALIRYGYKIEGFYIGHAIWPSAKMKFGSFQLSISPYIFGGMTVPYMESKPKKASTWSVIVLAGPLANILLLCLIYLVRGQSEFVYLGHLLALPTRPDITFWMWLIVVNVAGACELLPFISSDGTELLKVLCGRYTTEI